MPIYTQSNQWMGEFPLFSSTLHLINRACQMKGEPGKTQGSAALATAVAGLTRRFPAPRRQQMTLRIRYIIDSLLTSESMRSPAPVPASLWESSDLVSSPLHLSKAAKSLPKVDPKPTNPLPNNAQIAKIYSPSGRISPARTGWKLPSAQSCSPVPSHRVAAKSARAGLHAFTPVLMPRRAARSPAFPLVRMSDSQKE